MERDTEPLTSNNMNPNLTTLRHSIRTQWIILSLALTIFAGVIAYQSFTTYRDITYQEHQRLQTQVRVIALNIEKQLEATNLALSSVVNDITRLNKNGDLESTNSRLQALADALPGIRTMFVLDSEGIVVASNRNELVGRDFHTRDYFATPSKEKNPSTLYVSPPFKTVLGSFLINVSRIIPTPDGGIHGVVTAALDPEYFQVLLNSVLYAPDMFSAINHADGIRFMVVPDQDGQPGKNLKRPGTFYTRHRESGKHESVLTGKSPSYDSERVMALRTVQPQKPGLDKPLYVACSRKLSAIYENWYSATFRQSLAFLLISIAAGTGLALLQRRQRRLSLKSVQTQELINLRLRLMEYSLTHDMRELLGKALDEVCSLSGSQIGYYHFVEPNQQSLTLQAWSSRAFDEFRTVKGHGLHYPVEDVGIWADCIRRQRPVIHNKLASQTNRKELPEGNAALIREMAVPIFRAGQVVAILGIGNKSFDYTSDDTDLVSYLADVVWEIIERKRSEEERYKLGIRYQTLQSVSRDGIHILDQEGNLVESNESFRQMLGYTYEECLQLNVTKWDVGISPEDLPAKVLELIHAPAIFETRHRRHDGTIFDAEVNVCGVQLDGAWHLYASSRDISKRKELENSLRESRQLQADIFDFLPDATFVVDQDKTVIAWNRAMEEMSGVPKEEMLGQGDYAYTIPFYGDRRHQLLDLIEIDDEEIKSQYRNVTKIGERLHAETFCPALHGGNGGHVWAVVAPLYDCDGKRIGAIESIRNIDTIKQTEANLARSNEELEQFAYVASHDLQEPLRKIAGFTELLATRYTDSLDEKGASYMAYIVDGATRMRCQINDLLNYSRVMSSNRELAKTDCSAVVSRVLRDMEPTIKESNTDVVCGPMPVILADHTQLGQLFQNLIGNAIKYRGAAPPKVTINAAQKADCWIFSVADNGIGIAPEFHERIFAIFQRLHTRTEYPGTGIGLAVCKKIVERHGGKIHVESTEGHGSTFFFTIPSTSLSPEIAR